MLQLKNALQHFVPLEEGHWQAINDLVELNRYAKGELFHQEGKRCSKIGFIIEGCFRSVKEIDGIERTFDFAVENEFITDYYSVVRKEPSSYNLVAVEDSVVACMDASAVFALFDSDMTLQKLGRRIAEETACYNQERLTSLLYDSPRIRYQKLISSSPEVVLRVPQHFIANYLGVTKETLSRIRKRMNR
jgi:CRP-like cAMP-binding protein